ncbi:MAG: hypothetical protein J5570_00645, partial [Lachnospiraceae bacterium]|nr:hypothetical protein [Lachnospiraceae bacterium]
MFEKLKRKTALLKPVSAALAVIYVSVFLAGCAYFEYEPAPVQETSPVSEVTEEEQKTEEEPQQTEPEDQPEYISYSFRNEKLLTQHYQKHG